MENIDTDVLVVGGGTAGVTAAIAAAEEGASVVLVESDYGLGGVGVRAGVHVYCYGSPGGIQDQLDETTTAINEQLGSGIKGFVPESKAMAIHRRMADLNIRVLYGAVVSDVIMEGERMCGAYVESEQSSYRVHAKVTIDSTGDGDVAYLAGAEYTLGRDWDGGLHTYSFVPRYVDAATNKLWFANTDIGWINVTDSADLSDAYRHGRRVAWRGEQTPANTHFTVIGPQLGIREGRLITGEYVLHPDDLLLDKRYDDAIMRCRAFYENHAFDYANESEWAQNWVVLFGLWKFGFGGEVPYRCLVPKQVDGLLIGCRAFSQTHDTAMMLRMQRDLHKIGEAAGTAAAWSVKTGVQPRRVDIKLLQQRLAARGVLNEQERAGARQSSMKFKAPEASELHRQLLKQPVDPAHIAALIAQLGGSEEPTALWWLWKLGTDAVPPLLEALARTEGKRQRGVAFALGLLKEAASAPYLLGVFRRRIDDREAPLVRTEPQWLTALLLLGRMGEAAAADEALALLADESRSTTRLFALHYLIGAARRMDERQRQATLAAINALLTDESLGDDYTLLGSGTALPLAARSMRWGLELAAGRLLERVGGTAQLIWQRYAQDRRGYAREAAERILQERPIAKQRQLHAAAEAPFQGAYDAIVVGGGVCGVSAAHTLAAFGKRVLLLEPTGTLGREITRAGSSFVRLDNHAGLSAAADAFYRSLSGRQGWFPEHGQIDPAAAGVAFDDMLPEGKIDVRFHVWPSRLLMDEGVVTGLLTAGKTGPARYTAPIVIDASATGKIAAQTFGARPLAEDDLVSAVRLMYNGIKEALPERISIEVPGQGELQVCCQRTFWNDEWRVTLSHPGSLNRAEWLTLVDRALPMLRERLPALQSGVLAHLGDDVGGDPAMRIQTGSSDQRVIGYVGSFHSNVAASGSSSVPVTAAMICNPVAVRGLYAAGTWLEGFPLDREREDMAILQTFQLGECTARHAVSLHITTEPV